MGFWSNFGTKALDTGFSAVGGVINAGISQMLGDHERKENYKYNEMAANAADQRQRNQFHDLYSYSAQMKELEKAGLNPALMYSGGAGGQGGATAPQGLGSGGVQKGWSPMDQMSLAQMKLIESQAEKNEAEVGLIEEQSITQQWQNFITQNTATTTIATAAAELESINANINKTKQETKGLEFTNELNAEMRDKMIQEMEYKVDNLILDLYVKASQGDYNYKKMGQIDEEIQLWRAQTKRWIRQSEIEQQQVEINDEWYEKQAEVLYQKLDIDKWLAEIKAEELGLKAEANQIEKKKAVMRLIGDGMKAVFGMFNFSLKVGT